jgi:carnosine N-methyltransferase
MQKSFSESSLHHKGILLKAGLGRYLENLLNCVEANQSVLNDILISADVPEPEQQQQLTRTLKLDHERLNDALVQIVREWTSEGQSERDQCFKPILEELRAHFPSDHEEVCVFVPGSGLARLPFEIALDGFQCVGNEQDMFLLFTASFIMNQCTRINNYRVYPWLHDLSNRSSMEAVTTPIAFPDINPSQRPSSFHFQMVPGDFVQVAHQSFEQGTMDAIVTTFFIDSAKNVIEYVNLIYQLLNPGGLWINMGGLNYAYEVFEEQEAFVPLPLDVFKEIVKATGFVFLRDELVQCNYGHTRHSMANVELKSSFFTVQKPTAAD